MLKSANLKKLHAFKACTVRALDDYLAQGAKAICKVFPENVHVWMTERDPTPNYVRKHHRYVLKIVLQGETTFSLDGHPVRLKAGEGVLIFPFQEHATVRPPKEKSSEANYDTLIISFFESGSDGGTLRLLQNSAFAIHDADVPLLSQIVHGYNQTNHLNHNDAVWALSWFLSRLLDRAIRAGSMLAPGDDTLFGRISDYIRKHIDKPISLKTLEEEFHISNSTLRRVFKKHSGNETSPARMIRSVKLYQSNELVTNSKDSIAKIASWCGYSDQFAFSRAFKRNFGLSPLQLRKRGKMARAIPKT